MLKTSACVASCLCSVLPALENSQQISSQETPSFLSSSRPYAPKGSQLFILGDWIYWKTSENGLSYALDNPTFDISDDTLMGSGHAVHPSFDWHSGLRLGIGYNTPHDGWDVRFLWTWYEDQAKNSLSSSREESPTVLPIFIHPNVYNANSIAACNSADADLFLHLNMLDLALGKQCLVSKSLSLKPSIGLRTVWLNQNYTINYADLFDKSAEQVLDEYNTNIKNDFWGLGILGSLGSEWNIKGGFSLFGDIALSLLYGFFDTDYSESFITPLGSGGVVVSETNNFHMGTAIADLQIGLRWVSSCIKDRVRLVLQAGWEQHLFFSQNQMMHFVDGQSWGNFVQNQGDITFQGWSAGAHLYF